MINLQIGSPLLIGGCLEINAFQVFSFLDKEDYMNKITKSLVSSFSAVILVLSSAGSVLAAENSDNRERAKDLLAEQGYSVDEADQFLQNMAISSEGTLVGIDLLDSPEPYFGSPLRAAPLTSTQILSRDQVKVIFNNLNRVGTGANWLGAVIGLKNPVLGFIISQGGMQNPNLRNAITQAYYQGKRVKIVTVYGASMSLNVVHYYVID